MSKPISALTQFQNQTGPIPLSQLDADLALLWNASNDMSTYSNYMIDSSGAPNSITVTPAAGLAFAYTAGIWIEVKVANTNTSTTVNINVNALGNQLVKNPDGTSPSVGQIVSGGIYALQYDGTNFQIIGGPAGGFVFAGFANPTASVGLTAVNGTATTAMRSDAAPALSQAISPTWSGTHTFTNAITVNTGGSSIKGGLTVPAPAAGNALAVTGIASSYAGLFTAGGTAGTQRGLSVVSTTQNASDRIININNGLSNLFDIFGDAHGDLGPNISWSSGGNIIISAPTTTGTALAISGIGASYTASLAGASGQAAHLALIDGNTGNRPWELRVGQIGTGILDIFDGTANASRVQLGITATSTLQTNDDGGTLQVVGWRDCPNNSQTASYQLALSDRGKSVDFNGASLTCTIPANGSVAFPIGTTIVITNVNASSLSIAITTDTLTLAGTTTTGTRTLAQNGMATILKVTSTSWLISGAGLT